MQQRDNADNKTLTSSVVVDTALAQHSVVLDFTLLEGRAVVGDDHQQTCP